VAVFLVFGVGLGLVSTSRVNGGDNPDRRGNGISVGQAKCLRFDCNGRRESSPFVLVESSSFSSIGILDPISSVLYG
jgi:hypothetical protein